MDRIAEESLLFDYYGNLLTEKKRRVLELYHEENLSLSEIAEEFGITRAAVHDSLKSARKQLAGYEERLGLVRQMDRRAGLLREIEARVLRVEEEHAQDRKLVSELDHIRKTLAELGE